MTYSRWFSARALTPRAFKGFSPSSPKAGARNSTSALPLVWRQRQVAAASSEGTGSKAKSASTSASGGAASSSSTRERRSKLAMSRSSRRCRVVEPVADAEFALVEPEGVGPDDRAAKAKQPGLSHRGNEAAGGRVEAHEAFGTKDADRPRAFLAPCLDGRRNGAWRASRSRRASVYLRRYRLCALLSRPGSCRTNRSSRRGSRGLAFP